MRSRGARLRSPYWIVATALAATAAGWRAWTVAHWSWFNDDWVYLGDVSSLGFLAYLFQDYNGHLMPAGFLVTWVITQAFPLQFGAAVVVLTLLAGFSVLVWAAAFEELFGPRLRLLLPLSLLALSPLLLRPVMWWASGIQVLPLQLLTGLAVLCTARLVRHPDGAAGKSLVATYVVALLFWEKSLLMLLPVAAVMVLGSGEGTWRRLWRHRGVLAALAAVSVGYLALLSWLTRGPSGHGEAVDPADPDLWGSGVQFVWEAFRSLLAPSLLGGPWGTLPVRTDFLSQPDAAVAVPVVGVIVLVAGAALWLRRRAWVAVSMVGLYLVVAMTSVFVVFASTRNTSVDWLVSKDDRYVADSLTVAVLGIAMLLSATREEQAAGQRVFRRDLHGPHQRRVVGWSAAAALGCSLVVSNAMAWPRVGPHPGGDWLDRARSSLAAHPGAAVVDTRPPDGVLESAFWPSAAWTSKMLAPLGGDIRFDGPGQDLFLMTDRGDLLEADIDEALKAGPGPVAECGHAVDGDETPIPVTDPLFPWTWGVHLDHFSGAAEVMLVTISGEVQDDRRTQTHRIPVEEGLSRTRLVHRGPVDRVSARLVDGEGDGDGDGVVCVTGLRAGNIDPADDPG